MIFVLFVNLIESVQYCITSNQASTCNCHYYFPINPENLSDILLYNQSIVDLYFCLDFDRSLNITSTNQQYIINSASKIQIILNFSQITSSISFSFQNVDVVCQNWNTKTLTVNSFTILQSSFRFPNDGKFDLTAQRFSGDYEGYLEFDSVLTNNLRILKYDLWAHSTNPSISLPKINSDIQQIDIEMMNDCYIEFQNFSVTFSNNFTLTINVKTRARINLYVTGTNYIFFSRYTIHGSNFIPVNIYNAITMPDRIVLRLNYNGMFGSSIPSDNYMNVGQFPANITVEARIFNINIPLTIHLYRNTILAVGANSSSILGSIIGCEPNSQIFTNLTAPVIFEAESIERLDGTSGSVQCSPQIHLILNRFTNHNFISGQRSTIYFRNLYINPGFNFLTNLEENPNFYPKVEFDNSGVSIKPIEGSFTFLPGEKHVHVSLDSSFLENIYFYRYFVDNSFPIICNNLDFDCNEWYVDLSTNSYDDEILPYQFIQKCSINTIKSLKCLSIQLNNMPAVEDMSQEINIGNNVFRDSYNSLVSDEEQYLSRIVDDSLKFFKIRIGVAVTIDLQNFKDYSTIIITGIDNRNSRLTLKVSDNERNIPLRVLVIDTCHVNFIGTSIQADKIVFHNCQFTNFTVDLNTNFLCVPLWFYSNEKVRAKKFSTLTIFNVDNISLTFDPSSVLINSVQIPNSNFDNLFIYPLSKLTRTVNYTVSSGASVKGVSLNFSSYYVDDYYVIERPMQSLAVDFAFIGNWAAVTSVSSQFRFGLFGVTTKMPQIPTICGSNIEFDRSSIVFSNPQPFSINDPLFLSQNSFIDSPSSDFTFSEVTMKSGLELSSKKGVAIRTLSIERDAAVSLNTTSSIITSLHMGVGSRLNSRVTLSVETANLDFCLEKVPSVTADSLTVSQIVLNFVNLTNSNPSKFLGVRYNIFCARSLACATMQGNTKFTSSVSGVDSSKISYSYQVGCTDPDQSSNICMYVYLNEDIDLILERETRDAKKVKPWVIAISIIIPLILLIVIIIVIIILVRKSKQKQSSLESTENEKEQDELSIVQTPKRNKIQAPIPPRRPVRWSPDRRRYVYEGDEEVLEFPSQTNDEEKQENEIDEKTNDKNKRNEDKNGSSKTTDNGSLKGSSDYHSQLSPTKSKEEKKQSAQNHGNNDDYDYTTDNDYF